jgi:DNA-binding beta-propeller fold protein YncE
MLRTSRWLLFLVAALIVADAAPGREVPATGRIDADPAPSTRLRLFTERSDGGLEVQADALAELRSRTGPVLLEAVPLAPDRVADLAVERFFVTSERTRFVLGRPGGADVPLDVDTDRIVLLRGDVPGFPASHVYLAIAPDRAVGSVDLGPGSPRFVLTGGGTGVAFSSAQGAFAPPLPELCGVEDPEEPAPPAGGVAGAVGAPQTWSIDLAVDTDYEFYELYGDADAAAAYVTSLYGAITDIYLRDVNARFHLTFVRIWDEPEGLYDDPDPLGPFRTHWNAAMGDVERDVAQLLTGRRNLPYGGVAWVSALCGSNGYSVAGYILGTFDDPQAAGAGNWDLVVAAHELGHNCGSLHTHSYGIDSCASGTVQRGSIMSYCHTTTGGTANIDLRLNAGVPSQAPWQSNPRDSIQAHLAESFCVVLDCNGNGVDDASDIAAFGGSMDINGNGVPDECEDCNDNGVLDPFEIVGGAPDLNGNGILDVCEPDCNGNDVPDDMDISLGTSEDLYGDGVPDECDADCDGSGTSDYNEIQADMSLDLDRNAVPDACQDCDDDGTGDFAVIDGGLNLWVGSSGGQTVREFHALTGVPVSESDGLFASDHQDVLAGPDGKMYVSSGSGNQVVMFDPATGDYLGSAAGLEDGIASPAGLAFRANGNLLVANVGTDSVLEFATGTGTPLGAFVAPGSGGLAAPFGMAFGPNGNLFVTTGAGGVLEYDGASGAFVGTFVEAGSGGLATPRGLLFLPGGNLLVASFGSDEVLEFDGTTGAFVGRFDRGGLSSGFWALEQPWTLRLSAQGDRVFVSARQGNAAVHSYDAATGLFLRSYYVLAQNVANPTGFDVAAASASDCNLNLVPDACDIASGTSADEDGDGVPDECAAPPPSCGADVDGSGAVDVDDLVRVILAWGPCDACPEDLDGDGAVAVDDLVDVILSWGPCP